MDIIKNLDRAEIEATIQERTGLSHQDINTALSSFFGVLAEGLAYKGYAEINGLGSFKLQKLNAEKGVAFDKQYDVPDRLKVDFNAFQDLREKIQEITGMPVIAS